MCICEKLRGYTCLAEELECYSLSVIYLMNTLVTDFNLRQASCIPWELQLPGFGPSTNTEVDRDSAAEPVDRAAQ